MKSDSTAIATLNTIADAGYGLSAIMAQGTLHFFFDSTFTYPFHPQDGNNTRVAPVIETKKSISEFKNLYVTPNPANEIVTIELPDGVFSNQVTGNNKTVINTTTFSDGLYLVKITSKTKISQFKVSIKH